jgi:hypothetical protein
MENSVIMKKIQLKFYAKYPYAQYITNLFHFNSCMNFNVRNVTRFILTF